jgi:hypothetical protein
MQFVEVDSRVIDVSIRYVCLSADHVLLAIDHSASQVYQISENLAVLPTIRNDTKEVTTRFCSLAQPLPQHWVHGQAFRQKLGIAAQKLISAIASQDLEALAASDDGAILQVRVYQHNGT